MTEDIKNLINSTQQLKLLYVEDNDLTRETTKMMLDGFFDDITEAFNGEDALEKFKNEKFDLIITDINMPKMDGIRLSQNIKQIDPSIPILVFSAHNESEYFLDAIKIGIDGYLLKPVELQQFTMSISKVVECLNNKKMKIRLEELERKQEKNQALKMMLHNVSHHWRQPLSALTTSAAVIEMTLNMNDNQEPSVLKSLNSINSNATLLSKMLDDFQTIFQYDSNKTCQAINVKKVIEQVIKEKAQYAQVQTKLLEFELLVGEDVLFNIIAPIIQNSIEMTTIDSYHKKIFIESYEKEDTYYISFLDNCGGVEQNNLDKLFEPYFTTHHQYFGKGLGLFFVHNIVENYLNGSIEVENKSLKIDDIVYNGLRTLIKIPKDIYANS